MDPFLTTTLAHDIVADRRVRLVQAATRRRLWRRGTEPVAQRPPGRPPAAVVALPVRSASARTAPVRTAPVRAGDEICVA